MVEQRTENPRVAGSIPARGTIQKLHATGGSSSVVEHRLAKARAAGSNPVFRSIFILWRHSQVAKAAVCKTAIPRFESGCRLQKNRNGRGRTGCALCHVFCGVKSLSVDLRIFFGAKTAIIKRPLSRQRFVVKVAFFQVPANRGRVF